MYTLEVYFNNKPFPKYINILYYTILWICLLLFYTLFLHKLHGWNISFQPEVHNTSQEFFWKIFCVGPYFTFPRHFKLVLQYVGTLYRFYYLSKCEVLYSKDMCLHVHNVHNILQAFGLPPIFNHRYVHLRY